MRQAIFILLTGAAAAALAGGCGGGGGEEPAATRPVLERIDQRVVLPRSAVSIAEALELAYRQCGLRWAAVGGTVDHRGGSSVGPFQVGQHVTVSRLLDAVARSGGTSWRWKRRVALFGPEPDGAAVGRLVGRLAKGTVAERRLAAAELADLDKSGPMAVEPLLVAGFTDPDWSVRWAALNALARIEGGTRRAQPPGRLSVLAAVLESLPATIDLAAFDAPDGSLWRSAVLAIGCARVGSQASALVECLGRVSPSGRALAAWSLGQLGGEPAVEALAKLLEDASQPSEVRGEAAIALGRIRSPDAWSALRSAARSAQPSTRALAAEGLGGSENEGAIDLLADLVEDSFAEVALAAADGCGRIGSDEACKALGDLLVARSAAVRRLAALGLGRSANPVAAALLASTEDKDATVRAAIADALGWLGGATAIKPLYQLASDPAGGVKAAAICALARIGTDEGRALAESWLDRADTPVDLKIAAIIGLGQSRNSASARALERAAGSSESPLLRRQACAALAMMADQTARGSLGRLIGPAGLGEGAGEPAVRMPFAIRAAGWAGGESSLNVLARALADGNGAERSASAAALADCRHDAAFLTLLAEAARDTDSRVIFDALVAAAAPGAMEILAEAAASRSPASLPMLATVLGHRPDPRASDALIRMLGDASAGSEPARIRGLAARSLGLLGDPAARTPLLACAWNDADLSASAQAVRALRSNSFFGHGDVKKLLAELAGRARDFGASSAADNPAAIEQGPNSWLLRNVARDDGDGRRPDMPPLSYESTLAYDGDRDEVIQWGGHGRQVDDPASGQTWRYHAEQARWRRIETADEPPGAGCARQMAYDSANQAAVEVRLAGSEESWQFDRHCGLRAATPWALGREGGPFPGRGWQPMLSADHPGPRGWTQCAYDSDRQVVLLFGGMPPGRGRLPADLWAYDLYANQWARLSPPASGPAAVDQPGPRAGAGCAYDPVRRRLLMIGGAYGSPDDATWACDPTTGRWQDLQAANSPGNFVGPMVYDSIHDVFIALEDRPKEGPRVHVYHPAQNAWSSPPQTVPRPRYGVIDAAFDSAHNLVVITGGLTDWQAGAPTVRETWTYRYAARPPDADPQPPLGPPRDLRASVRNDGTIWLTWSPPRTGKPAGYRVLMAIGGTPWTARFHPVAEPLIAATQWHDKQPLADGVIRYYRVVAVDDRGQPGPQSLFVRTQPARPMGLTISMPARGQLRLNWSANAEPDVIGYNVYRAPAKSRDPWSEPFLREGFAPAEKINSALVTATSFADAPEALAKPAAGSAPPSVFGYCVRAVNRGRIESGPSPIALSVPAAPVDVRVRPRPDGSTVLSWKSPPGGGGAGFFVFRADSAGGGDLLRLNASPIVGEAWVDRQPDPVGPRRRYYVLAVDAAGQLGIPSAGAWAFGPP